MPSDCGGKGNAQNKTNPETGDVVVKAPEPGKGCQCDACRAPKK